MKKLILVVLSVLLFSFAAVNAQETVTELPDLSFSTVADIFTWGDSAEAVYEFLTYYQEAGLEIDVDDDPTYGITITATAESDIESYMYRFLFDPDYEELYEIICITNLSDDYSPVDIMQALINNYDLTSLPLYQDESLDSYIANFDAGISVADDATIVILAGSEPSDEYYGAVGLVFIDRVYFES